MNKESRFYIRKLLFLLVPYKKAIVLISCCLVISTVINLYIPILSRDIMDKGFIKGDQPYLIRLAVIIFLLYTANGLLNMLKEKKRISIIGKLQFNLVTQSYEHLMRLRIGYFSNKNNAEILNNLNMDIINIKGIADQELFFVITQIFNIIGGIIGLFAIDYRLTLAVLLFVPIKYKVMIIFASKRKKLMDSVIEQNEIYAGFFGDSVAGVKEIRMFGILNEKVNKMRRIQEKMIGEQNKLDLLTQMNFLVDSFLVQMLIMILYIFGSILVLDLKLTIGSIFAFITYSTYVTNPISAILNVGYYLAGIIPSAKRYFNLMEQDEECGELEGVCSDIDNNEWGDLVFENVFFSYNSSNPVLKDISFKINERQKVAIIGSNGAGKTTLVDLILRFIEPSQGKIYLDGKELSEISLSVYREKVSVVSQQIYLFNDTIENNICLNKTIGKNELADVIRDSGLEELISKVSLDYVVGNSGAMLSGGQKQKIALARALIHDNPVVIFDEATSNTDVFTEKQMVNLLNTRLKNKTVIIITHKLSVLEGVDNILVLKDGMINGNGSYRYLLENNELFRSMVALGQDFAL